VSRAIHPGGVLIIKMSIANYRERLADGVAGSSTSTCFVAAVDCVSPKHGISADAYRHYTKVCPEDPTAGVNYRAVRTARRRVLEEAGVGSFRAVSATRVKTEEDAKRVLDNAREGARRVIVYTGPDHVVGLRPANGGWRMVGTSTPVSSFRVLTSEEVFPYLAQNNARDRGKPVANVVTLSPERRKGA